MRNLSEQQAFASKAAPGWVLVEPVQLSSERKSSGGIALVQNFDKNFALMKYGRIVSCGEYYDARSGGEHFQGWPLDPGTLVCYHPHTEWLMSCVDSSRTILAFKANDVIAVVGRDGDL